MNIENSEWRTGYISIVGRPNVGKSTLMNHLIGTKLSITSRRVQTTRHRIHGILTRRMTQFVFVDTPGFQRVHLNALNRSLNRSVIQTLQDIDLVLWVIEALKYTHADDEILKLLPKNVPVLLIINKIDKISNKSRLLPFIYDLSHKFEFAGIIPVSATSDIQLDTVLNDIETYLPLREPIFESDCITDRSERFLAAEIIREKIFRSLGDEVPYSTFVEILSFEEIGNLHHIHATITVERAGQKAMLIGEKGIRLKQIGTEARLDMEKLFGGKVHLNLWVKIKGGWADSDRALKSLGFES
ncbi:MAG TPA: GTPase Era [Burkholderiales bacterium]|nr:GTPase Era [Burkholderiales bacterium]